MIKIECLHLGALWRTGVDNQWEERATVDTMTDIITKKKGWLREASCGNVEFSYADLQLNKDTYTIDRTRKDVAE